MSITAQVDAFLLQEAEAKRSEKTTPLNTFYPSSLGQCIRKAWHEKKDPVIFPPNVYKYFVIGNLTHEWLQSKIFVDAKNEVPVKWTEGDIVISGRIDVMYPDKIVELKSIAKLDFVRSKPKTEHVQQLNMYMHATGVHKGTIVYVTKNELDIVEHDVVYDPEMYKDCIRYFKRLHKYLVSDKEPKPSKCTSPWSCEYCRSDPKIIAGKAIAKAVKAKKAKLEASKTS